MKTRKHQTKAKKCIVCTRPKQFHQLFNPPYKNKMSRKKFILMLILDGVQKFTKKTIYFSPPLSFSISPPAHTHPPPHTPLS
jgi:hypothetical protein